MRTIEDLQTEKRWITWKPEWDEKRQDYNKTPYSTYYNTRGKLRRAASDDPTTWDSYANVCGAVEGHDDMGVGLELTKGIAVIDIDCHDSDLDTNPLQTEILKLFSDTYCEISPSGKGIHILFCVDFDKLPVVERTDGKGLRIDERFYMKNSKSDLECYVGGATNRYMTFTGNMISDKPVLADCTGKLMYFLYKYMNRNVDTIEKLLDKARNDKRRGEIFQRLYDKGDMSDYNNDHSSADEALMNDLVYWLNGNYDDVLTAFYNSKLDRSFCLGHDSENAEKGNKTQREQYMRDTYNKAMNGRTDFYTSKTGRPRRNRHDGTDDGDDKKELFTIEIMAQELSDHGITIKTNDITNDVEISGTDSDLDKMAIEMYSELRGVYRSVNRNNVFDFISVIAAKNNYNPVLDMLNASTWDGKDHLGELYRALGIEDDELSKTLVLKWIWQGHILLRNTRKNAVGAEGILVFTGQQGKGKTTFFRQMAVRPEFSDTGLTINTRDKDDQRRVVTTWIAELGELDATFKRADVGYLKSFITREIDHYRLPYGRCDTVNPRRTNLGATVNETDFLVDQTGNRRYWTIPADNMNLEQIKKLDTLQIWLQVWEQYAKEDYEKGLSGGTAYRHGFRLDKDEFDQLTGRNDGYRYKPDWEVELDDLFEEAELNNHPLHETTIKQFREDYRLSLSSQKVNKYIKRKFPLIRVVHNREIYKLPSNPLGCGAAQEFANSRRIKKTK